MLGRERADYMDIRIIDGGVTAPKGYRAWALGAGIKKSSAKKDMAMLLSEKPAVCAGVYTKNCVQAAPVLWDKKITDGGGSVRAVVINSGNANACTGEQGYKNTQTTAQTAARALEINKEEVLIASTGVIGVQLPMDIIEGGVRDMAANLEASPAAALEAARAIMTTDTYEKVIAAEFTLSGKTVRMGAMAKGSGMIHPNMGTMLSFITTDADISKAMLDKALREDVEYTYNMVSVDGDTSTNDTVLLLANGMAGNPSVTEEGEDYRVFCAALHRINEYLAKKIAADGEGATKLIEAEVRGARSLKDARVLAKSVVGSSLIKAAVFGADANWGRIMCALGYSGGAFDPCKTDIRIKGGAQELLLAEKGMAAACDEEKASEILSAQEVSIVIELHDGEFGARAWGCDLTYDYVKINADYRS